MKLTIKIDMDNAAFADGYNGDEAARILHTAASKLRGIDLTNGEGITLFDVNGNSVGTLKVTGR